MIEFVCTTTGKRFEALATFNKINAIEQKHRLPVINKRISPTPAFIAEIAKTFSTSKTVAFALWLGTSNVAEALRKRHQVMAEIAYWYKIDPYSLTPETRFGLLANLPIVQAQQRIADGNFEATNYEHIYELVLLATGDEGKARKARAAALERYVDQQTGFK